MIALDLAIEQAVEELDKEHLGNWRKRIDADKLDMAHTSHCVLGQLYGNYFRAPLHLLALRAFSGREHSFSRLNEAWRKELSK